MQKIWMHNTLAVVTAGFLLAAAAAAQNTNTNPYTTDHNGQNTYQNQNTQKQQNTQNGSWENNGRHGAFAQLQEPFRRSVATVFLLPDLQNELGLTSTQVNNLKMIKDSFAAQQNQAIQQIQAKRKNLNGLLKAETPNQQQIQSAVTDIANAEAQRQVETYNTLAKMKDVLTAQQRSQWNAMSPQDLGKSLMAHMTLGELVNVAHIVGGMPVSMMTPAS